MGHSEQTIKQRSLNRNVVHVQFYTTNNMCLAEI